MRQLWLLLFLLCGAAQAQVFNKPASPVEFDPAAFGANSTPAPDSYYHFDEGSGTTLENIGKDAGNYDCTINGSDWTTDSGSPILANVAANGDYVTCPLPGITGYPFSMAAWYQKTTSGGGSQVLSVGDASVTNVHYGISDSSSDRVGVNAQNTTLDNTLAAPSGNSVALNNWSLVVVVFNSATDRDIFMKNEAGTEADNTGTTSVAFNGDTDRMSFFARAGNNFPSKADAEIAGVAIWKGVALSEAQVYTDLWNGADWAPFVDTASVGGANPFDGPFGGPTQ